jgi:hypothetical protein
VKVPALLERYGLVVIAMENQDWRIVCAEVAVGTAKAREFVSSIVI